MRPIKHRPSPPLGRRTHAGSARPRVRVRAPDPPRRPHLVAGYYTAVLANDEQTPTWTETYDDGRIAQAGVSTSVRYLYAVYWAVTTLTTVGYGDLVPTNDAERTYALCAMLCSALVFGYMISNIGSLVASMDRQARHAPPRSVPRSQLQLVGCGALFCAVMYEANPAVLPEGEAPWTRVVTARRLAELTDDTYTGEQVVEMSEAMLSSARIPSLTELTTATAFGFVTALTTPAPPAYPMDELFRTLESYAYFFVDLSLVWSPFILGEQHSDGATVGAASLLLAAYLHECVQPPLVELLQASIRAPVGSLEPCVQWLAGLVAQEMAKMATGKEVVLKTDKLTAVLQKHIDTAQDISTLPRARSEEHDEEEAEVPLDARLMPLRLLTIDWVLHAPPSSRAYLPLAHIPAAEQSAWERAEQVLQREAGTRSAAALSGVAARERDDPDEEDAAEDAEGVDAEKSEV